MTVTYSMLGNYGRMGNALFEVAATIGYAKKYNVPYYFPEWNDKRLFNISDEFFVNKRSVNTKNQYNEPCFTYNEIPYLEDVNLFGYFQSYKYFDHCKEYIREVLTPKGMDDTNLFRGVCGIHVRRGDYLKFPDIHPTQPIEYYNKAMELVPAKKFLIFSDDVSWCRQNFKGDRFTVTDEASMEVDFRMMTACNHFIIANSSFSWWAAWLSEHEDKVVVSPKKWFGKEIEKSSPIIDLIPPEWIQI
jgi:hypothetical protein